MKKHFLALAAFAAALSLSNVGAQPGMVAGPSGPRLSGDMAKIFGENSAFKANLEMHTTGGQAGDTTIPGKIAYLDGKSRFEMDLTRMKSSKMPPQAAEHLKQMGMGETISITRPDKKISYVVYPELKAYFEQPLREPEAAKQESDTKIETTELGKESLDGHDCVKNKVVVTDKDGSKHEFTVWNATDLKKFPVKIETDQDDMNVTMHFTNVKLEKPDAGQFDAPSDFKKYNSPMELMREEMMKRMGGGMGMPPGQ